MDTESVALIVSPPGDLQIGLQALLITHLDVDVLVVGEATSALQAIRRHSPAVIILDQDIPGKTAAELVNDIKTGRPDIHCIVLVNDDQGRQELITTGVDLVVVKGLPGAKLVAAIKHLINLEE